MTLRNLYYNYTGYPNYYAPGGNLNFQEVTEEGNPDLYNEQLANQKGDNKFLTAMNSSGGGGWAAAIGPAATNATNAILDTEASTADRVAGALGISNLAKIWKADTAAGDANLKLAQQNLDNLNKTYIQDASSAWGGANAVKLNNQQTIAPISNSNLKNLSWKDFRGNMFAKGAAATLQGAAAGSVGGPWGALGGAIVGLAGSLFGGIGAKKRARAAYADYQAKLGTIMSAQNSAYKQAMTNQSLSNMQALANGNTQQKINDMANIRAYGGNLFDGGGSIIDPDPPSSSFMSDAEKEREMAERARIASGIEENPITADMLAAAHQDAYYPDRLADTYPGWLPLIGGDRIGKLSENSAWWERILPYAGTAIDWDAALADPNWKNIVSAGVSTGLDFLPILRVLKGLYTGAKTALVTSKGIGKGINLSRESKTAKHAAMDSYENAEKNLLLDQLNKRFDIGASSAKKAVDRYYDVVNATKKSTSRLEGIARGTATAAKNAGKTYLTNLATTDLLGGIATEGLQSGADLAAENGDFSYMDIRELIPGMDYTPNTILSNNGVHFTYNPSSRTWVSEESQNGKRIVVPAEEMEQNLKKGLGKIINNTGYAMGGNLYTDLSPNMMSLWNNKQQIDQQKVNMQQMNFGLGNSFNQKINRFDGGGWFDLLFGNGAMQAPTPAQGVTESSYTPAIPYSTSSELRRRSYLSQQAVENARRSREADVEFWDRYRNDWGDRTPDYADMSEEEFLQESEGLHDNPNITGLPLSEYNRYKYRKYLSYPNNKTFGNAYLFRPSIDELRKKYPLEDLPVYKKGNSWYLKEGVPAINGYKNLESGGHKIRPEDFQDTIDELRRRAWDNEFYDYRYDTGEDLPNSIQFEGNSDTYHMQDNGKYMNDKGEYWDAGSYDDIRYLMSDGRAYDPSVGNTVKQQKREQYLKYKKEQEERAKKREEEGHVNDYWHKDIDDNFMSNPVVEHDEIIVKGDKSKKSDNVEHRPTQRQVGYKKLSDDLGGSEGVKHFQEQYNAYHPESKIKVDGKVGDETVRAFQSWNNEYGSDNVYGLNKLDVDGIYGEKSQEFMSSGIAKRNLSFANGGHLNIFANRYDFGGSMNGMDLPTGMQSYENGGTHEQNPYGGIQVGVDQQGNPNLVEEGEFRWGDYVFSDRINVDPTLLSRYNLAPATKHQNKKANKGKLSYADMAKKYAKKNGELANDPIGKNTLEAYMKRLQDAQEDQKFQDSMEQQKQDAINQYRNALTTPQQGNPMYGAMKYSGMGNAATQQGVNAGMSDLGQQGGGNEVLSNTNRSGNNMLHAFGGNLFWDGGTPQIKPKLLNVNPDLVLGDDYMNSWTANNAGTPRLFSSTTPMYTGENPEANFTAYQKRYPTLPSDAKGMQQLLVNEGFDIGNTGPNKDGVDGIWGNKSQTAWYDFLRAYNHRPNTMNQYDLIGSNNQPSTSNSQASYNGGLNLGVRDGDATTDANNLGDGQTSYGNAEGNTNIDRSNSTGNTNTGNTTTGTYATNAFKEDREGVPLYSTAGKFATFGKGLTPMLYDWMNKTNTKYDPNQRPANELVDMGNNSTFLRTADTIGGYRAPNLMDAERMNNAAQAQGLAALQSALSVGNGNRGFAAAQANQQMYNTGMGIGNNYATAQQANNEERYKTDAYNTAIDQFNANARNTSYQDNQKAEQVGQQMALSAKQAANDYLQKENWYADRTNRTAMDNRATNQAAWTDNALNYFITQAQENAERNRQNNDITKRYWSDKDGVMHYIGDSRLNGKIREYFRRRNIDNGTFRDDRLAAFNSIIQNNKVKDVANEKGELWSTVQGLMDDEIAARNKETADADKAKADELQEYRDQFDSELAQLGRYAANKDIYGNYWTSSGDLDYYGKEGFRDSQSLSQLKRAIEMLRTHNDRYNKWTPQNVTAYGGSINNENKSNKNGYYTYTY